MLSSREKTLLCEERIKKLQRTLENRSAYLIENPIDLFYLCGKPMSCGSLYIFKDESFLFVDGRYIQACKSISHLNVNLYTKNYEHDLIKQKKTKNLFFDGDTLCVSRFENLAKLELKTNNRPSFNLPFRQIKDSEELTTMKKNASILYECFEELLGHVKEGITEKELSEHFKILSLKKGATGFSFEPIIAFGENSAYPHHRSSDKKLSQGEHLLIDIGIEKDYYQSDMTRVVFFGNASQEMMKLHDVVLEAHDAALKKCKKGARVKDLDLAAREVMKKEEVEPLFTHGLGHGIGIETHESPRLKFDGADKDLVLETGMVITIEPGLYLEGKGGIRYEDTIVITDYGYENFFPGKQFRKL